MLLNGAGDRRMPLLTFPAISGDIAQSSLRSPPSSKECLEKKPGSKLRGGVIISPRVDLRNRGFSEGREVLSYESACKK